MKEVFIFSKFSNKSIPTVQQMQATRIKRVSNNEKLVITLGLIFSEQSQEACRHALSKEVLAKEEKAFTQRMQERKKGAKSDNVTAEREQLPSGFTNVTGVT